MRTLKGDQRGATAVEYGLIAGLIALGIVGSLVGTRGSLSATFGAVSSGMGSASGSVGASAPAQTIKTFSTAAGQPGVANFDYASKGSYVSRQVFAACNLGTCGAADTVEYKFSDGSYIDYRPANGSYQASFAFGDRTGTVVGTAYYYTSGAGTTLLNGDTLVEAGSFNGQSYSDNLAVQPDGSVGGTRSYSVNGVNQSSAAPTSQKSDFSNIYRAVAFAKSLP